MSVPGKNAKCKYPADSFCYVCAKFFSTSSDRRSLHSVSVAYEAYFGLKIEHQNWAPHFCCRTCKSILHGWYRAEEISMGFALPRIWSKPGPDHETDCFFCMVDITKHPYPDIPSSKATISHGIDRPVPTPPMQATASGQNTDPQGREPRRYIPTKADLEQLFKDAGATEEQGKKMMDFFQKKHLIKKGKPWEPYYSKRDSDSD